MRELFKNQLLDYIKKNKDIILLLGGVGYKFYKPNGKQIINCEASEQAMVDIAVGLALSGKIPLVYAITPHLYRAFEGIRVYIEHEKIPVKLIGIGRDRDYTTLGFTHWAEDVEDLFGGFRNICKHLHGDEFDLKHILYSGNPEFLTLSR